MPKEYTQTVNAARLFNITPTVDLAAGTMTLHTGYVVGYMDAQGQFEAIPDAGTSGTATVTVPMTLSLAEANQQLQQAVATQEGLDLTVGDSIFTPTPTSGPGGPR
jgi:hypothetical protein